MEYFSYDFPMSGVMVGSMIPGIRSLVQTMKVSTFLDGTNHPLIKTRQARPDVLQSGYPQMHGPHARPNARQAPAPYKATTTTPTSDTSTSRDTTPQALSSPKPLNTTPQRPNGGVLPQRPQRLATRRRQQGSPGARPVPATVPSAALSLRAVPRRPR